MYLAQRTMATNELEMKPVKGNIKFGHTNNWTHTGIWLNINIWLYKHLKHLTFQTLATFSTFVHLTIYHLDGSVGEAAWEIVRCPSVSVHGSLSCHAHLLLAHSLKLAPTSISTSSLVMHCIRSLWCGFVGHLTHLLNQSDSSDNILDLHLSA